MCLEEGSWGRGVAGEEQMLDGWCGGWGLSYECGKVQGLTIQNSSCWLSMAT